MKNPDTIHKRVEVLEEAIQYLQNLLDITMNFASHPNEEMRRRGRDIMQTRFNHELSYEEFCSMYEKWKLYDKERKKLNG